MEVEPEARCAIDSMTPERLAAIYDLRPFDPDASCPKCWQTPVMSKYKAAFYVPSLLRDPPDHKPELVFPEHIERRCPRCDYTWCQQVVPIEGNPVVVEKAG